MKKIFVIMLYFCSIFLSKGQVGQIWQCHTQPTQSSFSNYSSTDYFSVDESNKILNIYFHVIRRSDGTGGLTNTQISNTIQRLFNDYSQYNIQFNELGRGYINNTQFYNDPYSNYNAIIRTNREPNAINVYFLSPNVSLSQAENIPSLAYCIGGVYYRTSVISHEMGHCLGLYHTHSGSGCSDNANCRENINGSNCSTCGDLVCDTPADPCLAGKVGNDCNYMGNDGYQPDVRNIMSYAPPGCLTRFSNGQRKRMHYTIMNNPIFSNVFVSSSGIPRVSLDPPAMTCLSFESTRTFRAVNEFGQSLCNNPNVREIEWKIFDYSSNPPSMIQNYTTANCNNLLKESLSMYIHSHYQPYVLEFVCRAKSNSGTWGEWGPGHAYMVRSNCSSPQNIFNAYFDQSSATAIVSLTEEYYIIKEAAQQARLFKERAQLGAFQHSSLRQNDKEDSYDIELWNTNQRIKSFRTNEPTFQIPMARLPAGLYFVRVVKDGQTYTQKLIKK